jgi:pimeloyl-ACP methyl ester carboxylesterase
MNRKVFFAILMLSALQPIWAVPTQTLHLNGGGKIEIVSVSLEGETVTVILPNGQLKLPKSALAPQSLKQFFPEPKATDLPLQGPKEVAALVPALPDTSPPVVSSEKPLTTLLIGSTKSFTELPSSLSEWKLEKPKKTYQAKTVEFIMDSTIEGQPKVTVQVLVPYTTDGQLSPQAADMVFYCPYVGKTDITKGKDHPNNYTRQLWELAEIYGMTVFTALFQATHDIVDDPRKCYYYAESGSHDLVLAAREKILTDFQIQKRKLLLFAYSGGGTLGQRLALTHPEAVEAVAMVGGGRFEVIKKKTGVPWLVLLTRNDVRTEENENFVRQLQSVEDTVLYQQTPPVAKGPQDFENPKRFELNLYHTANNYAFDLMQQYLVSVAQSRGTPLPANGLLGDAMENLWAQSPYKIIDLSRGEGKALDKLWARYPEKKPLGVVFFVGADPTDLVTQLDMADNLAMKGYLTCISPFPSGARNMLQHARNITQKLMERFIPEFGPLKVVGVGNGGRYALLASCGHDQSKVHLQVLDPVLEWPFTDLSPLDQLSLMPAPLKIFFTETNKIETNLEFKLNEAVLTKQVQKGTLKKEADFLGRIVAAK